MVQRIKNQHNNKLVEFCNTITYPIYHLSIKSFQQILPEFNATKPFEYIPFQYSIHIQHKNGEVEHREFLADCKDNPKYQFSKQLCKDIPLDCTVLTNSWEYDACILNDLSSCFFEHSYHLLIIKDNLKDLFLPFKEKWKEAAHIHYDYNFISIQSLLDIQTKKHSKNLSDLELEKTFLSLKNANAQEEESIKTTLSQYCKIDTLLMIEVFKKFKSLI